MYHSDLWSIHTWQGCVAEHATPLRVRVRRPHSQQLLLCTYKHVLCVIMFSARKSHTQWICASDAVAATTQSGCLCVGGRPSAEATEAGAQLPSLSRAWRSARCRVRLAPGVAATAMPCIMNPCVLGWRRQTWRRSGTDAGRARSSASRRCRRSSGMRARSSVNLQRISNTRTALTSCHPKSLSCTAAPRAGLKRGSRGRRGSGRAAVTRYRRHHSGGRHSTGRFSAASRPFELSLKPWVRQMLAVGSIVTARTAELGASCCSISNRNSCYSMTQSTICCWRPPEAVWGVRTRQSVR